MASGNVAPSPPEGPQSSAPVPCEAFIDKRLRQTRRQLKGVDVAGGLMTLAAGMLAYLMFAAALDDWATTGGLGFAARLLLLLGLVAGGGGYFVFRVLPPLVRRINPVFAAQTIEQSRPTLKNSLINFLLLRNHRQEVAPVVYRALERRAAFDLADSPSETAVDRGASCGSATSSWSSLPRWPFMSSFRPRIRSCPSGGSSGLGPPRRRPRG